VRPPLLGNDIGELVDLSLASLQRSEPSLCQSPGLLVLSVSEQFHQPPLVRCVSSYLADDVLDKLMALAALSLSLAWADPLLALGRRGSPALAPGEIFALESRECHRRVVYAVLLEKAGLR